ncbi:MAG: type II toxin-antitoxin system RelE/ParE family toxin [Pseudorhodoplanes sp.]|nr:type II toxin-antitoxin system RelE/ParE family toxin [Pseudorhodoplanes sp.]
MLDDVKRTFGFAIYYAETGSKHPDAKPLKGFGGAGVLEVVARHHGDTYRAVYTVKFENVVYVVHAFQKKSKKGKETPKHDIDLIKARLKMAENHFEKNYRSKTR